MRHKRHLILAVLVILAMPLLACNPNVLNDSVYGSVEIGRGAISM